MTACPSDNGRSSDHGGSPAALRYAYAGETHIYKKGKEGQHQSLTSHMAQDVADDYNSVQRAHQNTIENHGLYL